MKLFNEKEAKRFLKDEYNFDISISSLQKRRTKGLPPRSIRLNGGRWYKDLDLRHWVEKARYLDNFEKKVSIPSEDV